MNKISEILDMAAVNLGIKESGESLDAEDANTMLRILKYTLAEMSIKFWGCKNYEETVIGKNPIILGTNFSGISADVAERPAKIEAIQVKFGDMYRSLDVKTYDDYLALSYHKPLTNFPYSSYVKYNNDYVSVYFYPEILPNTEVKIFGRGYMTDSNLTYSDFLEVPDEYVWSIVNKLVVNSCQAFHKTPTQDMITALSTSEKTIKANNLMERMQILGSDFQLNYGRKTFNSKTGGFF